MANIDYVAFAEEEKAITEKVTQAIRELEQLAEKYKTSISMPAAAYGMGGWYEPASAIAEADEDEKDYYMEGEQSPTGGYWKSSSHSC